MIKVKAVTGEITYTTEIIARNHQIVVDEPKTLEGQDKGMTPMELLAASLASCTSITLKMYVLRKNWPIKSIHVTVHLEQERVNRSSTFYRIIQWEGNMSEEQQKRLIQIANACPIHKLLQNTHDIITEIDFAE